MVNQEQAPPQQEMAKNPAPFTNTKPVGFNLKDVILNTKNKVALLYPKHSNKEGFLSNALDNSKVSFIIPTGGIYEVLGVNTFKKAIGTHYLSHSSDYVDPPSINIVRPWFSIIGYGEEVSAKGTLKKSLLSPSVNNYILKPNQPEGPPFTNHMMIICNAEKLMAFKAPKSSSNVERVPQGSKPGAKPRHKKHSTSKQPLVSSNDVTKVVVEMHKEDLQATGGPTSLGVTSEVRANPQLSSGMSAFNLNEPIYSTSFIIHSGSASKNDASAISIAGVDPGISAPSTDPHVLAGKTKSVSDGLEIVLTTPET
ncbi:hypothetical protein Tco_0283093 [Tanacetum coccineum]